jgi:hypothetical protein
MRDCLIAPCPLLRLPPSGESGVSHFFKYGVIIMDKTISNTESLVVTAARLMLNIIILHLRENGFDKSSDYLLTNKGELLIDVSKRIHKQ